MNVITNSEDELLAEHAAEYLLDNLADEEYPQDLDDLLAQSLDLRGLQPEGACKRIRLVPF